MRRALIVLAAALAGVAAGAAIAALALLGWLWASLLWSPEGQGAFGLMALCALLAAGTAVRCVLEDRRRP